MNVNAFACASCLDDEIVSITFKKKHSGVKPQF